jgi:hypothetical protein
MKKASWCVLAAAIGAGGCGSPAGLVPVSGKVLYRGEAATGAVVYFHRQAEPGSAAGAIPYGIVESALRLDRIETAGVRIASAKRSNRDGTIPTPSRSDIDRGIRACEIP